jgi:IS1 family transposase/transposase-like protein
MKKERPSLETLSCQNPDCQVYLQAGTGKLTIRKVYGEDQIRYLRCQVCSEEFSERKNTMLWGCKITETRAEQIAECLANGNGIKATARITKSDKSTIKRMRKQIGKKAKGLHDQQVKQVKCKVVEFDERFGFAISKKQKVWEGTAIDPVSKLTLSLAIGYRDKYMAYTLMQDVHKRIKDKKNLLVISDGFISYQSCFPEVFGRKYPDYSRSNKKNKSSKRIRPRKPKTIIRIPRGVAHAVVNKIYKGKRLVAIEHTIAHGTKKCVNKGLRQMGDFKINTSAIERSNLTARGMNANQVRKSACFARSLESRHSMAWWTTTVYNFSRTSRALRIKLKEPIGRKLYLERTPAMAAGIADYVWTTLELLRVVVPPKGG